MLVSREVQAVQAAPAAERGRSAGQGFFGLEGFTMSAEQDLRRQREALAQAVNSHDLGSMKNFIHPSYVGKSKSGHTAGYQDILGLAERLLGAGSDFQETVEIEDLTVSGDRARLTVRRTQEVTRWLWIKHRGTSRAVETWWNVDGRWQLVEEQEL